MNMNTKAAHTAEHAFIGSLQKILNKTLSVRKVEHKDSYNIAFIRASEIELDFEKVASAEKEVNRLILEGRKILHHSFSSLNEAKKVFPNLRANETRLENADTITVVEIENHDLAACAKEHVTNLTECDFFLVTRMSKSGNITEIDFSVGSQAREVAIHTLHKLLNICNETGANINSVENTVKKIKNQNEKLLRDLKNYSRKSLDAIQPYSVEKNSITLYNGIFEDLIDSEIREFASKKIADSKAVVIIANAHNTESNNNPESEPAATIVVAANESLKDIDCNKIVKEIVGRGGGKPHFATGLINIDDTSNVVKSIVTLVKNRL